MKIKQKALMTLRPPAAIREEFALFSEKGYLATGSVIMGFMDMMLLWLLLECCCLLW